MLYKMIKKNVKNIVQINMIRYTNPEGVDDFYKIEKN